MRTSLQQLAQNVGAGVAANLAGHAAELAGIPEHQRQYIAIGLNAFQVLSFFKAAKVKVNMNGACFAAGTNVIVGLNADGSPITRNIEAIQAGDYVLSRDQYDATDDLDTRRVTNVFRRTSDHLRVLTIRDSDGNVEVIKTTDEHPFYVQGRGWTTAGTLERGNAFGEADGSNDSVLISSVRQSHPDGITVFNFEVEGDHTYFVEDGIGETTAVWVHNTCFRQDALNAWSIKLGKKLSTKFEVHHIVPENMSSAGSLRTMLSSVGINPNDVVNSVPLLPKYHRRVIHNFNDDYIEELERRISPKVTQGPAAVKAELSKIGEELFDNVFDF